METNSTQQEILLITGTSFSSRQWSEKDGSDDKQMLSEKEKLEEACWHGLVKEMLPELFRKTDNTKKIFLWQICEGKSFLELDLGESPFEKDRVYSIDPYVFLDAKNCS
jgi:hypothetical protein